MAITFKLDDRQHSELVRTIKDGFENLVGALTGNTEEQLQQYVDQLAENLNLTADEILAALKQPTKAKGE